MPQRPENFMTAGEDPEETLVAPRFDADEARHAHPVVPLSEAPVPYVHASRRRGPRRGWTTALLAVALLAAAALGGAFATRFMQSPRAEQTQGATQGETQGETQQVAQPAAPQTAEVPPAAQPSTPAPAEATREDAPADRPATSEARPRQTRTAAVAPAVVEPAPAVFEDDDGGRRGRRAEKRRGREDEDEKEMRQQMDKAIKHGKGKEPRLVDVLTPPQD